MSWYKRNTFHKAGQSEKAIVQGVPRFQELLNATRDPKMTTCKIYFKEGNDTIQNLRKVIGHNIVELTLEKIAKKIEICIDKTPEKWYKTFTVLYEDEEWYKDFNDHSDCLRVELNLDMLYEYKLPLEKIAEVINKKYDDLFCVISPLHLGIIDIYADMSKIDLPEDRILFVTKDNAQEIYLDEVVQPILEKTMIAGIQGIDFIYYTSIEVERSSSLQWIVETEGTNYLDIMCCPIVDTYNTISNNVWEILEVLGIEAAREFLIEEFMSIMEGINVCHAKLLVERMTFNGTIASITRYTMRREQNSTFARSSFEETMDNFQTAAINGDVDFTDNISASIICGTQGRIGTGITDLIIDVEKLQSMANPTKLLGTVKEESEYVKKKRAEYTRK